MGMSGDLGSLLTLTVTLGLSLSPCLGMVGWGLAGETPALLFVVPLRSPILGSSWLSLHPNI